MLNKLVKLLVLIFLLTGMVFASSLKLNIKEYTLKNGMKVLILEKHNFPIFTGYIQFKVGSVNEWPGVTGASHLLEHMMFKGTKSLGTWNYQKELPLIKEIDKIYKEIEKEKEKLLTAYGKGDLSKIENLKFKIKKLIDEQRKYIIKDELWGIYQKNGGSGLNASTGWDGTQYYVSLPANRLELWAFLESDRIKNLVFREFYSERDVVYEERRLRTDTQPEGKLWEEFMLSAYTASPYHWEVVGYASDLENMRKDEVADYFKYYYAPNNAVMVLAGDLKGDEAIKIIKKYFEDIPPQNKPKDVFTSEPPQAGEHRIEVEFDAQPSILIGFHGPKFGTQDQYALEIISRILSLGRTSRFYKNLIEKKQFALDVSAFNFSRRLGNYFIIQAYPKAPHSLQELEEAIYQELENLKINPASDWELNKIKNQIDIEFIRSLDSNLGMAFQLGYAQALTGSWKNFDEREKLKKITPKDIQLAAQKYFVKKNRTVAALVSIKKEGKK
ncbi:MAG: insulinase family protein [Armatimonadetes bacterium]|nr:insulinase family protein [Armatimonadota bacterium]